MPADAWWREFDIYLAALRYQLSPGEYHVALNARHCGLSPAAAVAAITQERANV